MRLNIKTAYPVELTFEGAPAKRMTDEQALRRSVMSCLLWEREFYEDGAAIADRISDLAAKIAPEKLARIAVEARHEQHLRHVPLLLLKVLARHGKGKMVADTIAQVISRADELAEFVAIYRADPKNRKMLPSQMKAGLRAAFQKFDEYQLAKYNRDGAFKLRDVLFLCHAKPKDDAQAALWKRLAANELVAPDTWEVALSGGADKKATFERLIQDGNLGYLALLRNLRGMINAGCDLDLVGSAIIARRNGADKVLPFRYVAAARAAPGLEPAIDTALLASFQGAPKMAGKTLVVIDVSGSMQSRLSSKSDMTRMDAGCAVAAILRETLDDPIIYATAGNDCLRVHKTALVPARRGMALIDATGQMMRPLGGGGIFLNQVCKFLSEKHGLVDRMIVVTDEQDCGIGHGDSPLSATPPARKAYMINVASAKNGIGYGKWVHIDGFSENVIRFIVEMESAEAHNDG